MRKGLIGLFVAVGLCLPQALMAQTATEDGMNVFTLGDIVVSAEQGDAYQVSVSDVMTEVDIKAVNAHTLMDALKYMPGFVVTEARKSQSVSMNGMSMTRVLVLIDGVPFYETAYRTLDLNQIPAAVISRIEVVKGNVSVLYGPNAQVGMINVITKKGSDAPMVSAYMEGGQYDTYNMGVSASGSYGMFNGWFSVDHRTSNGWRMSSDYETKLGSFGSGGGRGGSLSNAAVLEDGGKRDNSDLDTTSVWTRLGFEPNARSEYYASFHYVNKEGGVPQSTVTNNAPYYANSNFTQLNRWDQYEELGVDLTARQEIFEGFNLTSKLFYHQHEDHYESYAFAMRDINGNWVSSGQSGNWNTIFPSSQFPRPIDYDDIDFYNSLLARSVYKDTLLGVHVIGDWKINDMHTIRGAAQYRQDTHKQKSELDEPFDDYTSYTGSVGLEYQLSLFDNHLGIVAGVSYDWFDVTKAKYATFSGGQVSGWVHPDKGGITDAWNPMIGFNFMFPEATGFLAGTELFGSVGQKTRFPTLREKVSSSNAYSDIDPEKSINYILGVQRGFFDKMLTVGVQGFFYDISDMIVSGSDQSLGRTRYFNKDDIDIYGIQMNLMFNPSENVSFMSDFTYNHDRDRSDGRSSNRVVGVPEYKIGFHAAWYIPEIGVRLNGNAIYVGKELSSLGPPLDYVDSYFLLGVKATKYLFDDRLEIYATVSNLLDEDYGNAYPGHGREFLLGTRVTF